MALRTYGTKPLSFQVEDNEEYWCMGSEVESYLGFYCGSLYKSYPGMFRRSVNIKEREKLVQLGLNPHVPMHKIFLVRVSELEDIIKGNDGKYKTASNHTTESLPPRKRKHKGSLPSATKSSHLDATLPAGLINHNGIYYKKFRTILPALHDRNPSANMKTAEQQGISIPLRTDQGIVARRLGDILIRNNNAKRVSREDSIATEREVQKTKAAENSSQLEATYKQKCRLCLKNYDQLLELFQSDDNLRLKIMAFASVKIERRDGLPSVICFSCRQLLDISYNFKCLVEKSDAALRKTLLTRVKMNQNAVKESLPRSVSNDFVMHYKSQLLALPNINHPVSNDYDNRQDSVAREINEESMSDNNHSHRNGPEDKKRDNESDNQKQAEKDDNSNRSEIIPRLNRSEILLKDLLEDGVSVSQSIQSMEPAYYPIKKEELLLPEEVDLSEGEDNHHQAKTVLRYTCYWCEEQFSDIAKLMNHATNIHHSLNDGNRVDVDNNYGQVETGEMVATLNKNIDSPNNEQIIRRKEYKAMRKVCTNQFARQESLYRIETHPGYKGPGTSDNHFGQLKKTTESWKRENNLSNSKPNESDDNNSPPEGLQCIKCGIFFPTKRSLRRHISIHNDLKFSCSICGKEFLHPDELKDHEQTEHKRIIIGTSDDKDYDTVDERREETENRPQ